MASDPRDALERVLPSGTSVAYVDPACRAWMETVDDHVGARPFPLVAELLPWSSDAWRAELDARERRRERVKERRRDENVTRSNPDDIAERARHRSLARYLAHLGDDPRASWDHASLDDPAATFYRGDDGDEDEDDEDDDASLARVPSEAARRRRALRRGGAAATAMLLASLAPGIVPEAASAATSRRRRRRIPSTPDIEARGPRADESRSRPCSPSSPRRQFPHRKGTTTRRVRTRPRRPYLGAVADSKNVFFSSRRRLGLA